MIYEILILCLLGGLLIAIWRLPANVSVNFLLSRLLGLIVGALCFQLSYSLCSSFFSNIFLQWGVSLASSLSFYFLFLHTMRPRCRIKCKYPKLIKTALSAILLLGSLVAFVSFTSLIAADESLAAKIHQDSLYLHAFKPANAKSENHTSWQKLKSSFADASGSKDLADNVRALRFILHLNHQELQFLIDHESNLQDLLHDKKMLLLIEDKQVLDFIDKNDYSLKSLYHLGKNKSIKSLLKDEESLAKIRRIKLPQLAEEIKKYRLEQRAELKVNWTQCTLQNMLDLDHALSNEHLWSQCNSKEIIFPQVKIFIVHALISEQGKLQVICKSEIEPLLLIDDLSVKMTKTDQGFEFNLAEGEAAREVLLIFDIKKPTLRHCTLQVFKQEK